MNNSLTCRLFEKPSRCCCFLCIFCCFFPISKPKPLSILRRRTSDVVQNWVNLGCFVATVLLASSQVTQPAPLKGWGKKIDRPFCELTSLFVAAVEARSGLSNWLNAAEAVRLQHLLGFPKWTACS